MKNIEGFLKQAAEDQFGHFQKMMSDNNTMIMAMFGKQMDNRLEGHTEITSKVSGTVLSRRTALEEKESILDLDEEQGIRKRRFHSAAPPIEPKKSMPANSSNPLKVWISGFPRALLGTQLKNGERLPPIKGPPNHKGKGNFKAFNLQKLFSLEFGSHDNAVRFIEAVENDPVAWKPYLSSIEGQGGQIG